VEIKKNFMKQAALVRFGLLRQKRISKKSVHGVKLSTKVSTSTELESNLGLDGPRQSNNSPRIIKDKNCIFTMWLLNETYFA
jgi:hypothetical protein